MSAAPSPIPSAARDLSPVVVCDALIDAAIGAGADTLWLEPRRPPEDRYDLSLERQGRTIAMTTLDGALGAALVARLAILADLDLVARRPTTGRCVVRRPTSSAELIVTTRPGRSPRAEVFLRGTAARLGAVGAPVTLEPGAVIGHYQLEASLGAGGMGQVFRARHRALGRPCALKVLHHGADAGEDAVGRFLREARAAARIKHPNIVDVFDFGHLGDGRPYLVMELLDGRSLADVIGGDPLEPRLAVRVARELAGALAAAHAAGVVHADVSPSNVLLEGETAKLVDFGLSRTLDDPERGDAGEEPDTVFGTPSYIAPEVIRGLAAEPASDQYGLGAVLYEMLTGDAPYHAATVRELCIAHLSAPIPRPESPHAQLPAELVATVVRCLAKRPEQRFPSMAALEAALVEAEQSLFSGGWRRWLTP